MYPRPGNLAGRTAAALREYAKQSSEPDATLQRYRAAQLEGVARPDERAYVAVLKACRRLLPDERPRCLETVKLVHQQASLSGYEAHKYLASSLVDLYAKCGCLLESRRLFDKMEAGARDVVVWTSMILGYTQSGHHELALDLYQQMQREASRGNSPCSPNALTLATVLKACASLASSKCLEIGREVHQEARLSSGKMDVVVASALVDMYAKCGSMVEAEQAFNAMPERNVVSWTCMVMGCCQSREFGHALELCSCMQDLGIPPDAVTFLAALKACIGLAEAEATTTVDGRPVKARCLEQGRRIHSWSVQLGHHHNVLVASSLVDMYAKCGSLDDARRVFETVQDHDAVSWTTIILGHVQCGHPDLALGYYRRMRSKAISFQPDVVTFVAILKACGSLADVETGKMVHDELRATGLGKSSTTLGNTLVDFYGKCGCMDEARQVFDGMQTKSLVSWNALIGGYSRHGNTDQAFRTFELMSDNRVKPDRVTFLALLSACGHSGHFDRGTSCLEAMSPKYGVQAGPEHYSCMVDLLCRANRVQAAMDMVNAMPCQPDRVIWTTLLNASRRVPGNDDITKLAFDRLVEADSGNAVPYILASRHGDSR